MNYMNVPSKFKWENLGDIETGRQNIGSDMPVVVYRLLQYTMRDVVSREYGETAAAEIFKAAGHLAGIHFAKNMLDLSGDFDFFVANLQKQMQDLRIGILRIERADLETLSFTLTVSEDLDCSGLPISGETVCDYDEGFIAGILEAYTGEEFHVKEIDCWATGDRTCRFTAETHN